MTLTNMEPVLLVGETGVGKMVDFSPQLVETFKLFKKLMK
jgi:midasin (ATPase involved in ribosome maturation)